MMERIQRVRPVTLYIAATALIIVVALLLLYERYGGSDDGRIPDLGQNANHVTEPMATDTEPILVEETASEDSNNRQGVFIAAGTIIVVLALFVAALAVAMAYLAFSWRKSIKEEQVAMLPNQAINLIDVIRRALEGETKNLQEFSRLVTLQIQEARDTTNNSLKADQDILEALAIFQKSLSEKDAEIERLRKGGEAIAFRKFLKRFIRAIRIIEEEIADAEAAGKDTKVLSDIRMYVEDALEESGIDVFHPTTGKPFQTAYGVAERPDTIPTENPDQHLLIASIEQPGYALVTPDGQDLMKPAIVKVYKYQGEESTA